MRDMCYGVKSKNGKFLKFVLHEILQVEETAVKEMDNWKATPRDNVRQFQDDDGRIRSQQKL